MYDFSTASVLEIASGHRRKLRFRCIFFLCLVILVLSFICLYLCDSLEDRLAHQDGEDETQHESQHHGEQEYDEARADVSHAGQETGKCKRVAVRLDHADDRASYASGRARSQHRKNERNIHAIQTGLGDTEYRRDARIDRALTLLFILIQGRYGKCCAGLGVHRRADERHDRVIAVAGNVCDTDRNHAPMRADHDHGLHHETHKSAGRHRTAVVQPSEGSRHRVADQRPERSEDQEGRRQKHQTAQDGLHKSVDRFRQILIARLLQNRQESDRQQDRYDGTVVDRGKRRNAEKRDLGLRLIRRHEIRIEHRRRDQHGNERIRLPFFGSTDRQEERQKEKQTVRAGVQETIDTGGIGEDAGVIQEDHGPLQDTGGHDDIDDWHEDTGDLVNDKTSEIRFRRCLRGAHKLLLSK